MCNGSDMCVCEKERNRESSTYIENTSRNCINKEQNTRITNNCYKGGERALI